MGLTRGRQRIRGRFIQVGVDPALLPNEIEVRETYRESDPMNPGKKVRRQRRYMISREQAMERLDDPSVVASLPEEAVMVFDDDGSVASREDYTRKVDAENDAHKGLSKINQLVRKKRGGKGFAYIDPAELRSVSRMEFEEAFGRNPKPDEYVALTDDPYKSTALTKIYPVKDFHGKQVITAGRFKGYYVADLVNRAGRMIEGSSTYYNPATGELDRREVTNDDGSVQRPQDHGALRHRRSRRSAAHLERERRSHRARAGWQHPATPGRSSTDAGSADHHLREGHRQPRVPLRP